MELSTVNVTLDVRPAARQPLMIKLLALAAISTIPQDKWHSAALRLEWSPLKDPAVPLAFIEELVRSLKELRPEDYKHLNSYMITGAKNVDCRCNPDRVPNLGRCEHAWGSASDPCICHGWQFRAF